MKGLLQKEIQPKSKCQSDPQAIIYEVMGEADNFTVLLAKCGDAIVDYFSGTGDT